MKPQVSALARFKARQGTRRSLQHLARQPAPDDSTSSPAGTPTRQQARHALRQYLSH